VSVDVVEHVFTRDAPAWASALQRIHGNAMIAHEPPHYR
jgi:hypothetical protein